MPLTKLSGWLGSPRGGLEQSRAERRSRAQGVPGRADNDAQSIERRCRNDVALAEIDSLASNQGTCRIAGWAHVVLGGSAVTCLERFGRARGLVADSPAHVDHEAAFAR